MSDSYDVILIGAGGAMGSSAAMHLALRGQRVLGIDRYAVTGHDLGSSHGRSRMIRLCYYEHADYVPLLRRAYQLWSDLELRAGLPAGTILNRTGGVYMGLPDSGAVAGSRRAAEQHGLDHEVFTRGELARRYPQFEVPGEFVALYEPMAGFLRPELVVATHTRLAAAAGAELRGNEPVLGWSADSGGVRVTTERGELHGRKLVLTPGAFAASVLPGLGRLVRPTRQVLGWVRPRHGQESAFALGALPVWAIDAGHLGEGLYYGFPMLLDPPPFDGFKLARHAAAGACSPDDPSRREIRPDDEGTFRPCLQRWIPAADGPVQAIATCMYENSPDGHFIIDHHPSHPNVVVACGFSGHGFKFASVVGEIIADLITGGRTRHPIEFLGLSRFAAGSS